LVDRVVAQRRTTKPNNHFKQKLRGRIRVPQDREEPANYFFAFFAAFFAGFFAAFFVAIDLFSLPEIWKNLQRYSVAIG
jgi:hypothetical protein